MRINFKILLITYKSLNGVAPKYIDDLLELLVSDLRSTSGDPLLLRTPKVKMVNYGEHALSWAAPTLWNVLPLKLRECSTTSAFKSQLKTHLFK